MAAPFVFAPRATGSAALYLVLTTFSTDQGHRRPGLRLPIGLLTIRVGAPLLAITSCPVQGLSSTSWGTQPWTVEDGLAVDGVSDVRFGPGGYLYPTTFDGLARFNGTPFTTSSVDPPPPLPGRRFRPFVRSAADELRFVPEHHALVPFRVGAFTAHSARAPLTRTALSTARPRHCARCSAPPPSTPGPDEDRLAPAP